MAPAHSKLLINITHNDISVADVIPFVKNKPTKEIKKGLIHDIVEFTKRPECLIFDKCPGEYHDKLKQNLPKNVKHRSVQSEDVNKIFVELGAIFAKWKETLSSVIICKRDHLRTPEAKACKEAIRRIAERYDECVQQAVEKKIKSIHSGLETVNPMERFRPIGMDGYPADVPPTCFNCGHSLMEGLPCNQLAEQENQAAKEQYEIKLRLYNDRDKTDHMKEKTRPPANPTIQNGQLEPFIYHCVCYKAHNNGPEDINCPACIANLSKDDGVTEVTDECEICNCSCNIAVRLDTLQDVFNTTTLQELDKTDKTIEDDE